jgi:hypothetical protein
MTSAQIQEITATLSATRLATFDVTPGFSAGTDTLDKYRWHALTSAAFFASIHICEISIRNGVAQALTRTYGPDWPWSPTFERSLPSPFGHHFNAKKELVRARAQIANGTAGKVIAELKFAFWCHMFTSRYQRRIWDANIGAAFPNLPISIQPLPGTPSDLYRTRLLTQVPQSYRPSRAYSHCTASSSTSKYRKSSQLALQRGFEMACFLGNSKQKSRS